MDNPARHLVRSLAAALACAFLSLTAIADPSPQSQDARALFEQRWFSPTSPWNVPISASAKDLDGSHGFISAFIASGDTININREIWTPIVLYGGTDLPRCDIVFDEWQLSDFPRHPSFVDDVKFFEARGDTDASFCVYSEAKKSFFNMWNVRLGEVAGKRRLLVGTGAVFPIQGAGWWDNTIGPWSGRSSGASYCAGLIRLKEYESGEINHALAMSWPVGLIRGPTVPGAFVFPARTTDGRGRNPVAAVPMGARLQLDPQLTDDQLIDLGVSDYDLPIAHALQRYGAYVVDSGSAMAIYAESSAGRDASTDRSAGGLPVTILTHARFVAPPEETPLDSKLTVGQPVPVSGQSSPPRDCLKEPTDASAH